MMADCMVTPLFHNQFRVPSYQDWVDEGADWSLVYEFHERQLQHLQSRVKRDRWVLKTGAHMWGLEHLLARYPDARIVFTHRDPVKSMTSYASLTALVRSMGSEKVDRLEIARDWTARIKRVLEHAIAVLMAASSNQPPLSTCRLSQGMEASQLRPAIAIAATQAMPNSIVSMSTSRRECRNANHNVATKPIPMLIKLSFAPSVSASVRS